MIETSIVGVQGVDRDILTKAVAALLQIDDAHHKKDLFLETDARKINLQFTFVKVPSVKNKTIKISLPHSLQQESTEVCLFVKDLNKKNRDFEPTVDHFQQMLREKDVHFISEIIPLMSLKTEYKPFEAKKNLSNRFDVFLADDSIVRLLPSHLGKNFFGRKKVPVQVDLTSSNLKDEMQRAVGNTRCIISGRGPCSMVTCAHTAMPEQHIVDNIITVINRLSETVPGGAENLKTFNLKTEDSLSVPIMILLKSPNKITLPVVHITTVDSDSEPDDVTTIEGGKVKVTKDGEIILFKRNGTKINLTGADEDDQIVRARNPVKAKKQRKTKIKGNIKSISSKKLGKASLKPKKKKDC